ncbi:MAG: hypothetical protein QW459_05230 [Sulfolobales archaeon]
MSPKSIGSILILSVILASLLLPVANIVTAQVSPGRIVEIKTAEIYPGELVVVSIEVYMATTYTVKLCPNLVNLACTNVWSWASRYASVPGVYDVILTLPESLPGANDGDDDGLIDLYVVLEVWGAIIEQIGKAVYPKVVVTPPSTTVVVPTATSPYYTPVTVTVRFLGYLPGDTVSSIRFEGPLTGTYPITPVTIGTNGTESTLINLLNLTDYYGLPRGDYKVIGIPVATNITNVKPGSLEIRPQVIVTPMVGNGRCDADECELEAITITGYGFGKTVEILKVEFFNINFTNVRYTFTPPTTFTTNEYGYFTKTNLKDWTPGARGFNMTAGLYIPIVYEAGAELPFEFRNVYYLVRPLLILLTPEAIYPGTTVTIAAYGYGPDAAWGYPEYNTLYVYWEKILLLGTFTLGKDGNLTFKVKIPEDAAFGAHYIWGVDKWGYEYTLAIIVGAKAYWYTGKTVPEVWAGYNDKRVEVCPCPQSLGVTGVKYCAQCAVYTAKCDYLGDVIKVVVAGLSPGETIRVYFGGRLMLTARVNKSTEEVSFVVPSVPEGTYTITVVGTASGSITVTDFFDTTKLVTASPKVVPKVLILDLNKDVVPVLVGSGFVRVIGSGFPAGIAMYAVLFNGTDAAYTLNAHVTRWLADARGILTSPFTDVLGIYVPVVEPGAYAISLAYSLPDGTIKVAKAGYVFVVNNISILLTKAELDKATATLSSKIDAVSTALSSAVALLTSKIDAAVTELRSRIDAATGTITSRIDSSTAALSSKIDAAVADIKTKIDASTADLKAAIDGVSKALSTAVTTITSKVDAVSGKVDTVSSKVDTVSSKVDAVAGTLKTVSDALSSVAKDVSEVKASVDTIKTDVTDIKGVKTDIAALKTDLAGVKSDVAGLKTDLTAVRSDVATVRSDVAGVKSDVAAIPGRIDGATMASYIAVVFALLAFIMATLAFITIRKVTGAPK